MRSTVRNPRPLVTTVPESRSSPTSRPTGTDSPVIADSSTCSAAASSSRPSAGTTSPASSRTTSPGTRSAAATRTRSPSRSAVACGAASRPRASTARSARSSWLTPMTVLSTTTAQITMPSERSPSQSTIANATMQQHDHRVAELAEHPARHAAPPGLRAAGWGRPARGGGPPRPSSDRGPPRSHPCSPRGARAHGRLIVRLRPSRTIRSPIATYSGWKKLGSRMNASSTRIQPTRIAPAASATTPVRGSPR